MKTRSLFIISTLLLLLSTGLSAQKVQSVRAWYESEGWQRPQTNPQLKVLPLIRVSGNVFVNEKGDTLLLRGLSISDPDKIENQGHWNRAHFEKVKEMGATVVRIPVHPVAWRERTPEGYLTLLDQAVSWCTELGMYVIIDWHSIGNLEMELFQNPMYNTTKRETYEFWRTIAAHFKGHNTVAFYELFNEPTIYRGQLGSMSWKEWKEINENMIRLIRAYDEEPIPLVAGLDWAYDLNPIRTDPIEAEGIAYVSHPYEHKRTRPWEPKWEEAFGFAAGQYPVMVTEFGFGLWGNQQLTEDHYAYHIIEYLEAKGISWVCWVFDPQWGPNLLKSWDKYDLTESGEFFKKAMKGEL
ncbi:MAG: glycoside hydrolase family 5 protein [Bacteroidota bacterium]